MIWIKFTLFLFCYYALTAIAQKFCSKIDPSVDKKDSYCLEDDYDHKQLPPFNHMKVLICLVEIYEFNDLKETIDFNVKIGFSWIGNGITWIENNSTEINDLFDLKKKDLIWTPTFTVAKTIDFSIVEHFESTSYMFLRRLDENLTRFYYSFNRNTFFKIGYDGFLKMIILI